MACIIDGEGPFALGKLRLRSERQISGIIAEFDSAGCSQVKIYSSLDPRLIAPLAKAAHAAGMTVTGHIPDGIGALGAVDAGFDQINHLSYVMRAFLAPGVDPAKNLTRSESQKAYDALDLDSPASRQIAATLAAKHIVVDPTLALSELGWRTHDELVRVEPGLLKLPPAIAGAYAGMGAAPENAARGRQRLEKNLALLGMLHRAGVPIVTGTDQAVPGHSEAREIELYVEAGFTPMEAIQAATIVPARVMKLDGESGTVEPGKRADLIVVDGDPLRDIHALRNVVTVVAAGRSFDPKRLWESVGFKP
jgi:imidazolonepropionase-like amidohydrolase